MKWLMAGLTTILCSLPAAADELSGLYDQATLAELVASYSKSMTKTRDEFIWNKWLLVEEKRKLANPPRLDFPLWGEGKSKNDPLTFYAPPGRGAVVLPVLSLKFL